MCYFLEMSHDIQNLHGPLAPSSTTGNDTHMDFLRFLIIHFFVLTLAEIVSFYPVAISHFDTG